MIEENNKMRCVAAVDIKKGEKLAITYVELIMPGVLRRNLLKKVRKVISIECVQEDFVLQGVQHNNESFYFHPAA